MVTCAGSTYLMKLNRNINIPMESLGSLYLVAMVAVDYLS